MTMTQHTPSDVEVEVASGRYVNLTDPDPATICLDDIAHALAMTCRFGGHPRRFYSVAEHAVLVAHRLDELGASPQTVMAGLHHDDSEAYLHDFTRPMLCAVDALERGLTAGVLRSLTSAMDWAVWQAVGKRDPQPHLYVCGDVTSAAVAEADDWALAVEARHLMPSLGATWGLPVAYLGDVVWHGGLGPETAKMWFLTAHRRYAEQVVA